jgi:FAD/FMN-containing dehydrogenase
MHLPDAGYADPELTAEEYPKLAWGDNFSKLQQLKHRYDPGNLFRWPQSIRVDG